MSIWCYVYVIPELSEDGGLCFEYIKQWRVIPGGALEIEYTDESGEDRKTFVISAGSWYAMKTQEFQD